MRRARGQGPQAGTVTLHYVLPRFPSIRKVYFLPKNQERVELAYQDGDRYVNYQTKHVDILEFAFVLQFGDGKEYLEDNWGQYFSLKAGQHPKGEYTVIPQRTMTDDVEQHPDKWQIFYFTLLIWLPAIVAVAFIGISLKNETNPLQRYLICMLLIFVLILNILGVLLLTYTNEPSISGMVAQRFHRVSYLTILLIVGISFWTSCFIASSGISQNLNGKNAIPCIIASVSPLISVLILIFPLPVEKSAGELGFSLFPNYNVLKHLEIKRKKKKEETNQHSSVELDEKHPKNNDHHQGNTEKKDDEHKKNNSVSQQQQNSEDGQPIGDNPEVSLNPSITSTQQSIGDNSTNDKKENKGSQQQSSKGDIITEPIIGKDNQDLPQSKILDEKYPVLPIDQNNQIRQLPSDADEEDADFEVDPSNPDDKNGVQRFFLLFWTCKRCSAKVHKWLHFVSVGFGLFMGWFAIIYDYNTENRGTNSTIELCFLIISMVSSVGFVISGIFDVESGHLSISFKRFILYFEFIGLSFYMMALLYVSVVAGGIL